MKYLKYAIVKIFLFLYQLVLECICYVDGTELCYCFLLVLLKC